MTVLILAICFGLAVCFELWAFMRDPSVDEELTSRKRIKAEIRDIEAHRPTHIISNPNSKKRARR